MGYFIPKNVPHHMILCKRTFPSGLSKISIIPDNRNQRYICWAVISYWKYKIGSMKNNFLLVNYVLLEEPQTFNEYCSQVIMAKTNQNLIFWEYFMQKLPFVVNIRNAGVMNSSGRNILY